MNYRSTLILSFVLLVSLFKFSTAQESGQITCSGTVVDTDGKPVNGVKVTVYEMNTDGLAGNINLRQVNETLTQENGTFTFNTEPKPTRGTFVESYVVATKQGQSLGWQVWDMHENAEFEIEIGQPEKTEGIIVDEESKPVVGAIVCANLTRNVQIDGEQKKLWLPGISPLEELGTQTDSQGKFLFNNLPKDTGVDILVTAEGKATTYTYNWELEESAFETGQTDIKVTMPEEARVEGRIIDIESGKGIANLKFAAVYTGSSFFYHRLICTTNEDGTFEIGGLQEGRYLIRGEIPTIKVDLIAGRTTNDVLIGVNRRKNQILKTPEYKEADENIQIYFKIRLFRIPSKLAKDIFESGSDSSSEIFIGNGYELTDKLLKITENNEQAKLLFAPQILTNNGHDSFIETKNAVPYISGYEEINDDSDKLKEKIKYLNEGIEIKVCGTIEKDNKIFLTLSYEQQKADFETVQFREGYEYKVPLQGKYLSAEGTTENYDSLIFGFPENSELVNFLIVTSNAFLPEPEPESLVGKTIPEFDNIKNINNIEAKPILFCFFDIEQRPSRNCILELSKKSQELKKKDIEIIAIHASKIEREYLEGWTKENSIDFPIGMIEENPSTPLGTGEEQTLFDWGVKALPWLILTDEEHIVQAEGFSLDQLDEKIEEMGKK